MQESLLNADASWKKKRKRKQGKTAGNVKFAKVASTPPAAVDFRPPTTGPLRELLLSVLPDAAQLEAVQSCLGHVQILARQLLGESAAIVVQGSYAQGLALRGSDLDVAVIIGLTEESRSRRAGGAAADAVDRRQALVCLRQLALALQEAKLPEIRIALRIFSAKVPVLRLHCGAKGERSLVVDVSVGGSLLRGACDRSVYDVLKQDKVGISIALCRLVKLWAKRRKLTNTLKGGLSSFAFVLLTIFFLQQGGESNAAGQAHSLPPQSMVTGTKPKPANPHKCCPPPLGLTPQASEDELTRLLGAFFRWASEDLPRLQSFTLSVENAKAERRPGGFKPLMLAVPFAPTENAARCLRADVWEMLIRKELLRASRFMKQIVQMGPDRKEVVRSLFSAAGKDQEHALPDDMDIPETEEAAVASPSEVAAWEEKMPSEAEGSSNDPPLGRAARKRRRKIERAARKRQSPPETATMPEVVAPVDRWLGLRSLLNPQ
mmetsp:Transcript_60864/g.135951  ORF Transcript_60864/g.135951 Transcript_60864/m.135951 type:complete len:491 (-) Transcript_60864:31-1503(-)